MMVEMGRLVSPELLLAWADDQRWSSKVGRELMELVDLSDKSDEPRAWATRRALEDFQSSPQDPLLAVRLSRALQASAESDESFRAALARWVVGHEERSSGPVNIVTGGTFNGSVVQGRDFNTVHIFTSDPGQHGE